MNALVLISGLDMPSGKSLAGSDSHRAKGLTHRQIVKDSSLVGNCGRRLSLGIPQARGNKELIVMPKACKNIAGNGKSQLSWQSSRAGKTRKPTSFAHWIWQQYASSFWDDIRIGHVLLNGKPAAVTRKSTFTLYSST